MTRVLLIMLLLSGFSLAQHTDRNEESGKHSEGSRAYEDRYALVHGTNEWGLWGAISVKSWTPIGNTIYRTTWLAGVRYGRILGVKFGTAFEYTFDFVPMALVRNDPAGHTPPGEDPITRDVYGFGIWPAGIKFIFGEEKRVRPFIGINSGLTYYSENVPYNGRRANIAGNLDAGIHIPLRDKNRMLTIAYKYHHVSNAYTAPCNIGTNVNMVMVGLSIFK